MRWRSAALAAAMWTAVAGAETVPQAIRLQLATGMPAVALEADAALTVLGAEGADLLPPGSYRITVEDAAPARDRYHLFSKTFPPSEAEAEAAYLAEWTAKGYEPVAMDMGRLFQSASGAALDNRIRWISLARFATEAEALAKQKALQGESVWAWVRREQTALGGGSAVVADAGGTVVWRGAIPMGVTSEDLVTAALPAGKQRFSGGLEVRVENDGRLGLYESVGVEDYIAGVLPSEMPALWPAEALKAQAIAARSDTLAHLNLKHALEGFDYTTNESNRVYKGAGGRHPNTDAAAAATAGEVLVHGGRIVPAVFSATCGGYSEDNDAVWSGPADPMLRARADFPAAANPVPNGPAAYGLSKWLQSRPRAYCMEDERHFRWTRTISGQELSAAVNKAHKVGAIRAIELGERGPGGRLKWVKVTGSAGSATIHKEFPIRQAFGGLPSALFIVDTSGSPKSFTFIGGGRGHGVGLCQNGARGMAAQGASSHDIVRQYYSNAAIERVE